MMNTKPKNTEERIREAARVVFTKKGYAATRTRDIAEAAGLNLSLLNYYFRSKEKLFELVMMEKIAELFGAMRLIVNNKTTTLAVKIEKIAATYIDLLHRHPDLPIFVLSEIRNHPKDFAANTDLQEVLKNASLMQQLKAKRPDTNPIQFFLSLLGMTIFPYIVKPLLHTSEVTDEANFERLMAARKKMIPIWMNLMLEVG